MITGAGGVMKAWVAILFFLGCGLTTRLHADTSPSVMRAEATPAQVAAMIQEASTSGDAIFKAAPGQGSLKAEPGKGYRTLFTVRGERLASHLGAAKVLAIGTIGDEGGGKVIFCNAEKKRPPIGPISLTCTVDGAFHVETAKEVVIRFGLGSLENISVTGMGVEVTTEGARSELWVFSKLIPALIGLAMLGYWFFVLRR